jgi:hypothetical protein
MIRHVVMFKFKPDTDQQNRDSFVQMLNRLPQDIEVGRGLELGQNFANSPRAMDIVITVDFDDHEALGIYAQHPKHLPVIEHMKQICSESRVVDYEV